VEVHWCPAGTGHNRPAAAACAQYVPRFEAAGVDLVAGQRRAAPTRVPRRTLAFALLFGQRSLPVSDEMLNRLHEGGGDHFAAAVHQWTPVAAMAPQIRKEHRRGQAHAR
jgi:hypothetical protein